MDDRRRRPQPPQKGALSMLKEDLRRFAWEELGLVALGVAAADPFEEMSRLLTQRQEQGLYPPFADPDIGLRCDPQQMLPGARTLLAGAVAYWGPEAHPREPERQDGTHRTHGVDEPGEAGAAGQVGEAVKAGAAGEPGEASEAGVTGESGATPDPKPDAEQPLGRFSRYALGLDYHRVLRERLDRLARWLCDQVQARGLWTGGPVPEYRVFVDTGPSIDREVARRAGIGWYGKNCCIYVGASGSWVFLGTVVTNVELPPDPPIEKDCGRCTLCIDACPTGALEAPYRLDPYRCIGYLTQMPGEVPEPLREPMGNWVWGCDVCQEVCPWNHRASGRTGRGGLLPELLPRPGLAADIPLIPLLSMTGGEFRQRFGETAAAWRGKRPLQRNAAIALGNLGDRAQLPVLSRAAERSGSEVVREAARWALERLRGAIRPSRKVRTSASEPSRT